MNRCYPVFLIAVLFVAGCSSSKNTAPEGAAPYYLGAFEDFDPDQYEDVTPPLEVAPVDHEIPKKLTTRPGGSPSLIRGFRVQLNSSLSRTEANATMQKAISWWEEQNDTRTARPPVYMEYEQPYYKVRLGNFKTRDSASEVVGKLGRMFAGAFVVPSLIESPK